MRVVIYGDDRLRVKCEPVDKVRQALRDVIADMAETMYAASGIGLAAPQVGILERFLVLDVDQVDGQRVDEKRRRLRVFINPEIVSVSEEDEPYVEGCLSIPGVEAEVFRPSRVRVRYRDLDWAEREEDVEGLLARVIQHEIDHLDGVLFVDRLNFMRRRRVAGQLQRLRKERENIIVPAQLAESKAHSGSGGAS